MHSAGVKALLSEPSWWQTRDWRRAVPPAALPTASDLVVIGGGITGLSAALTALDQGYSVTLLERAELGSGATGRNSGFVVPIPGRHTPASLQQRLGVQAQPYIAALAHSAEALLAFPHAQGQTSGWVLPYGKAARSGVMAAARDWTAWGIHADVLEREQLPDYLGTNQYHCAINFRQGGQLNPLALVQSMGEVCRSKGGMVIECCPALAFTRTSAGYRVQTPQGEIAAGRLLVAGNAYGHGPCKAQRPSGAGMVLMLGVFDLPPEAAAHCLPRGIPFSDAHKDMWFFRRLDGSRLMTGLFALPWQSSAADSERMLRKRILTAFGTEAGALLQLWGGRIGLTHHALPHLCCPNDSLAYWTGCNGRGLALSHALGSMLAQRLLQGRALDLPLSSPWPLPAGAAMRWLAQTLVVRDRRRRTRLLLKP
ncbi:MAG: FAD-dependent oxidoreductase [Serratia proteamaculans]